MEDNPYHPPSKATENVEKDETLRKIENKKKAIKIASLIAIVVGVWTFALSKEASSELFGMVAPVF